MFGKLREIVKLDWLTILLATFSVLIGVITLYGGSEKGETLAMKNLLWLVLGLIIMFILALTNYQILGAYALPIYLFGVFLLIIVILFGTEVNGARSWFRVGSLGFQPTEFMKLAIIIALSKYLVLKESEIDKLKELIIPFIIVAIPLLLIFMQPDLGSAILLLPILFMMLFIGGANVSVIFGMIIIGFMTLFIPMFLEYQNFIMVSDIYLSLSEINYNLANSVKTLGFDVWAYINNPELPAGKDYKLAVENLTQPDNLELVRKTVAEVKIASPNFLRDFLGNEMAVLVTILVTSTLYGLGLLGAFLTRSDWMKPVSTALLIVALSLLSSYALKKIIPFKSHQVIRIVSFANPDKFSRGAGYQLRHSLVTIGSGQLTGKGLFQGQMTGGKTPFLPEWFNDFIFSVIGEQLGFFGCMLAILLLFGIIFRGATIALQSKDDFGALLASGITTLFFFHIIINIGITMGLFPVTGIPLTFISYGGSNLVISFAALGIVLNIQSKRHINA